MRKFEDPIPPDQIQHPTDGDLAARLAEIAGADIDQLELNDNHLTGWNKTVSNTSRSSFEHRIMLGIGINRLRPAYGKVVDYQTSLGKSLVRSTRWVQATMSVSATVDSAIQDGIVLPRELCDLSWYAIPAAIKNVRNGRPLDWKPKKEVERLTPEQQVAAATKAYKALDKALDAVEDPSQRASLAQSYIAKLEAHTEVDAEDPAEPEPEPEPEPESEPEPGAPSHPRRPGRRRR